MLSACSYFDTGPKTLTAHSQDLSVDDTEPNYAPVSHHSSGEFPEYSEIIHVETRGAVKIYPLD